MKTYALIIGLLVALIAYAIWGRKLTSSSAISFGGEAPADTGNGSGTAVDQTTHGYNDPDFMPQTTSPFTGVPDVYVWVPVRGIWALKGLAPVGDNRFYCTNDGVSWVCYGIENADQMANDTTRKPQSNSLNQPVYWGNNYRPLFQ